MRRKVISIGAILCGVMVLLSTGVNARILTVGLDGTSECNNIQTAVDAAVPDDTILLADGIYTGQGNRGVTINKPLTIRGIRGPERCIIDCEGWTRGFTVQLDDPGARIVLEGLTVTGGFLFGTRSNGPIENGRGGGILLKGRGSAILRNCVIANNRAIYGDPGLGGGICFLGEWNVYMDRCRVEGNTILGAIGREEMMWNGPGGWAKGGGIYLQGGSLILNRCVIIGNLCKGGNAGFCWNFFDRGCENIFIAGSAIGGAIAVEDNENHGANVNMRETLIIGNRAYEGYDGRFDMAIVTGPTTGIALSIPDGILSNCTIMDNTIQAKTGSTIEAGGTGCIITNSILQDRIFSGASVQLSYCWIEGDPLFVDRGYWDTKGSPYVEDHVFVPGDYHLKSQAGRWDAAAGAWVKDAVSSPCIDAGDPADTGWVNELWPNGRRIDIGAYGGTAEASLSGHVIGTAADLNFDDRVDIGDFAIFARGWMRVEPLLAADLTRDGRVGIEDLAVMAESWLVDCLETPNHPACIE